jgi:hypothetical protein
MRTIMILLFLWSVFFASQTFGAIPVIYSQNNPAMKGYITIDRNVVVLPERLQLGDRIELFRANGTRVMEQYVGTRYLSTNISNMPQGMYSLVIYRANKVIATRVIPIMGMEGR